MEQGADLLIYELHPPDDLRLFRIPPAGVLRADAQALVIEVAVDEQVLRHYQFRDHWFTVNCTFDRAGRLVETAAAEGHPAFALNCDIATPLRWDGRRVLTVDLWIDALVQLDGGYEVVDEDDFAQAIGAGWLGPGEIVGALGGLVELTALLDQDALLPLLEATCPFGPSSAPPAEGRERLPSDAIPELLPGTRPTWQTGAG